MYKNQILQEIDREWERLLKVTKGFSEKELRIKGAVGQWNTLEALLHLAAWDEELVSVIKSYLNGGEERDYGDNEATDLLNAQQVHEKRGLTPDEAWDRLYHTHETFLSFLNGLPEDVFKPNSYVVNLVNMTAGATSGHYRMHGDDLERFKSSIPYICSLD